MSTKTYTLLRGIIYNIIWMKMIELLMNTLMKLLKG